MKLCKYVLSVAGVAAVILICIFLPANLAERRDLKQAGQVIPADGEVLVFQKNQLDTISKLSLAMEEEKKISNVTVRAEERVYLPTQNHLQNRNTAIREEDIIDVSIRELNELKEAGIIPELEIGPQPLMTNYALYTYIDTEDSSVYVLEWNVFLSYPGFSVNLTLEDESSKIYSFIVNMGDEMKAGGLDISGLPQKWAEYLALDLTESTEDQDDILGEYCENDAVTWFRFGQSAQPRAVSIQPAKPVIVYQE